MNKLDTVRSNKSKDSIQNQQRENKTFSEKVFLHFERVRITILWTFSNKTSKAILNQSAGCFGPQLVKTAVRKGES